jgi:hypothetical protein
MATETEDFTTLDVAGDDFLATQYPYLVRALQGLAAFFEHKVATGTEPSDILEGLIYGESPNRNEWRILVSSGDLLIQENTGSEGSPTWTTRNTFATGSGLTTVSDHGGLGGLSDDDHTQYVLADGSRNITGSQTVKNTADASLKVVIDAGTSTEQIAEVVLADQGTESWSLRKTASGTLVIRDLENNQDVCTFNPASGADHIVINSVGVGIKKTAADSKALDVQGDARVSGNLALATLTGSGAAAVQTLDTTASNEVTKAWGSAEQTPSSSGNAITFDFSASNYFEVLLDENITSITISNTGIPGPRTIVLKQAAASSFTVSGWPSVVWAGGTAPSMPTGFDDEKVITILVKSDGSLRGFFADDFTV